MVKIEKFILQIEYCPLKIGLFLEARKSKATKIKNFIL
jgi:hypothetical protein